MKHYTKNGVRIVEVPVGDFRVELYDGRKNSMGANRCTGGFFGRYDEEGDNFTLPVGHLACDYAATSKWTEHYCRERGTLQGDRFRFDSGAWSYMNPLHGKSIATLVVADGRASVQYLQHAPEQCDYAISGVPVLRNGHTVTLAEARAQGWESSSLYATWHVFVGLKSHDTTTLYIIGMKTTSGNLISSGEAAAYFKAMELTDVVKLDGGGSYYFNAEGDVQATAENRRICTVLDFGEKNRTPLYKVQVGAFAVKSNAEKLRDELAAQGYPVYIVKTE